MINNKFLSDFCDKFSYPNDAKIALTATLNTLNSSGILPELQYYIDLYNNDSLPEKNDFLKEFTLISEKANVNEWSLRLLFLISLVPHLRELYKKKNISEEIFNQTVFDLKYKMTECFKVKKSYGIWVDWWDIDFFRLKRFALGRLQFELYPSPVAYNKNGFNLKKGDTVINVHIPSSGALIREEYLDSYRRAAEFFKDDINGEILFFISSWLLYPENRKFLKPTSNILPFVNDYNLINYTKDKNDGDIWRFFSIEKLPDDIDALPEKTSMQKSLKQYFKDGNHLGVGNGVMAYKDGNIIR